MNKREEAMNRRSCLVAAAATLVFRPVLAQTTREPLRIGWLGASSREVSLQFIAAFKAAMQTMGRKDGEHYVLVERWANNQGAERNAVLAAEVAATRPAVIVAFPNGAVQAASKAAPDTPIVMATGTDPVGWGFAASLARPGGMVTGNANMLDDLGIKYAELLLAAAPGTRRVGFLQQHQGPHNQAQIDDTQRIVKAHALDARLAEVKTASEIEPALARFAGERVQGLIVTVGPLLLAQRALIVQSALQRKWPMVGFTRQFADDGALMSFGPNFAAQFQRAAYFVDRILKGAKPLDLPFEQPTVFEFVVNRNTAKAIGVNLPQALLLRADEVIG